MSLKTFAEMQEAINQHREGLLHNAELIMALQCDTHQVEALRMMMALPQEALFKLNIIDFDNQVERGRAFEERESEGRLTTEGVQRAFDALTLSRTDASEQKVFALFTDDNKYLGIYKSMALVVESLRVTYSAMRDVNVCHTSHGDEAHIEVHSELAPIAYYIVRIGMMLTQAAPL